ncbi:MAG: hypothetical protein E7774_02805 [Bradyrhizobium sp.]|nr:MAG: hypothetical protein E7774_02805 [Bradyrhizobium sp.]
MARLRLALLAAALIAGGGAPPIRAQSAAPVNPRIALVIGESAYADATLTTPVNDAALVAQTLQAAGFDVAGARDLDEKSLRESLRDFLARAAAIGPDMQAFVYLAGRGVQYEGENFFAPVDAEIARDSDVPIEAVRISDFAHALSAEPGRARIVVLDAARAGPYAAEGPPLAGGLALVEPDEGELIAFNAAPGAVAGDEPGPYGAYAHALAGAMRQGGVPIEDALAQVRVRVNAETGGGQLPWSASKLAVPYYVFELAGDAPAPAIVAALAENALKPIRELPPGQAYVGALARDTLAGYSDFLAADPDAPEARRVRAMLAARREALYWRRAVALDMPPAYWTYLARYRHGPHVADAARRLAILSAPTAPPDGFAPLSYEDLPPPPANELADAERPVFNFAGADYGPPLDLAPSADDDWRHLPPPAPPVSVGLLPALAVALPLIPGARAYRDGGRRDGRAPPGAPEPLASIITAPPLPGGIEPRPPPRPAPLKPPLGVSRAISSAAETPANPDLKFPPLPPPRPTPFRNER